MSKEIEEIIRREFCEKYGEDSFNELYTHKYSSFLEQKIEQLKKEVEECKEWTQTVVDRFNVANEENTKLKEGIKEFAFTWEGDSIVPKGLEKLKLLTK